MFLVMEAAPVAALEVVEAKLLLQFLIVPLDAPAHLDDLHQWSERPTAAPICSIYRKNFSLLSISVSAFAAANALDNGSDSA